MPNYFLDTSAVLKRYIPEIGSAWITALCLPAAGNILLVSEIANIEIFSAIARRQREKSIAASAAFQMQQDFLLHVQQEYLVFQLDKLVIGQAQTLVTKHVLRTLDAIQLASVLEAQRSFGIPIEFLSADNRLLAVAAAEGLSVDNPNLHP